jgi:NADH dehydrogenase
VVHVSITNPSLTSPLSYFRGKAQVEQALVESGLSSAILRPAVFFGGEDILLNNIAWALRRFPVFAVFGRGDYRLRPIHVDDFARLVLDSLRTAQPAVVTQAVGPETFSYRDLVGVLGHAIGCVRPLLAVPPMLGWLLGRVVGLWQHDTFITRDEIRGLMTGLLDVDGPAAGPTRLTDWTSANAANLGRRYASEMARRTAPDAK